MTKQTSTETTTATPLVLRRVTDGKFFGFNKRASVTWCATATDPRVYVSTDQAETEHYAAHVAESFGYGVAAVARP